MAHPGYLAASQDRQPDNAFLGESLAIERKLGNPAILLGDSGWERRAAKLPTQRRCSIARFSPEDASF